MTRWPSVHAHIAREPEPLCDVAPDVPAVIGEVVSGLLQKPVDARYHSARGLLADLERCRHDLRDGDRIESFPVREHDVTERFLIPARLYGREDEAAELVATFEGMLASRSASVRPTGVLVTGGAGLGKTALVREIFRPLTEHRGHYVAGKFDQYLRVPFSGIVAAFQTLVTDLLAESPERLERLRNDLVAALGPNGRLITDVIPQVETIIGAQSPVEELGAAETANRFERIFRKFVRVFAQPDHPVVVFLDDLQWADPASLSLMRHLLSDDRLALFVIGAYRPEEVHANHPLKTTLAGLAADGRPPSQIDLSP